MTDPATTEPVERRFYTVPEAAEALRVSRSTVHDMVTDGRLGSVKLGGRRLIPVAAMDQFCEALSA